MTIAPNYIPSNCLVECWLFTGNANDESGNTRKFNSYHTKNFELYSNTILITYF